MCPLGLGNLGVLPISGTHYSIDREEEIFDFSTNFIPLAIDSAVFDQSLLSLG